MQWECEGCGKLSDSFSSEPCECEYVWGSTPVLTPDDTALVEQWAKTIDRQIRRVCDLLDYRVDYYEIDSGTIEVYASWAACSRGCCGTESSYESFPVSYLCMSDDDIKQTEAGKKAEAERRRVKREAEAKKARELAAAQRQLKDAKSKVRTAQADAERNLADAQARLARIEGGA